MSSSSLHAKNRVDSILDQGLRESLFGEGHEGWAAHEISEQDHQWVRQGEPPFEARGTAYIRNVPVPLAYREDLGVPASSYAVRCHAVLRALLGPDVPIAVAPNAMMLMVTLDERGYDRLRQQLGAQDAGHQATNVVPLRHR